MSEFLESNNSIENGENINDILATIDNMSDNDLYNHYTTYIKKLTTNKNNIENKKDFNEKYLLLLEVKFDVEYQNLYSIISDSNGVENPIYGKELNIEKVKSLQGFNKYKLEELLNSIIITYEETNIRNFKSLYSRAIDIKSHLD